MVITETPLKGAFVIELEPFKDVRGFFACAWSDREFAAFGDAHFVETNISFNEKKGTLRGMHYQTAPHEQAKLVRCTRGSIYDVIIDLRPESATFKQWFPLEMSARSEEHTSELQSRREIVCRLLLENKNHFDKNDWYI